MIVSDHRSNPYGIQWQRYHLNAPYPDLVKTVPHIAFEVNDLGVAPVGHRVIIRPTSPSPGLVVTFVEVNSAQLELMETVPEIIGVDSRCTPTGEPTVNQ